MVWLASYPKCGNTWLRLFLSGYLNTWASEDEQASDSWNLASRRQLNEMLGIETADLTGLEVRELLPIAIAAWATTSLAPRFVKTHDAFGLTRMGEPLFPEEHTLAVIHLVRDPRDVVVSWHHHTGDCSLQKTVHRLNDPKEWIARGSRHAGGQVPQFISDWSGHARSWLESPLRRLTVRYEDMLADPRECFRRILRFCALDVDEAQLARAVDATSFERLRQLEVEKGFRERPVSATAPFFRQGRMGAWREVLTDAQADIIVRAHRDMMIRLGYAP